MKFFKYAAVTAGALMTMAGAAAAQDVDVAFNVAATTDYVFRGFSQTDSEPAIQGGVDATIGSFYVGAWASNVEFFDDTDGEIDLYGGYRTEAAGYALDFGVVGYFYPGGPGASDYDYLEFKAAASRAVGPATFGAVVFYSPDFFGAADEEAVYVEGNLAWALDSKWTVSGALGHQTLDVSDDYTTWNVGAGYAFTDNLVGDLRYHDTDVDTPFSDERVVATLKVLF
ncbi:TorF family putative porin [Brevundimonas balnearis]|uniref:TorF family putative porin n=1 Tax=Brevundimonas balnearis TaxID=1572858 RepID=A0ABV6R199_9CAUL